MNFDKPLTRRESLKKLLQLGGSLGLAGAVSGSLQTPVLANASSENKKFIVEGIGQTEGYSVKMHGLQSVPQTLPRRSISPAGSGMGNGGMSDVP